MPWTGSSFVRDNGQFQGATIWDQDRQNSIRIESIRHDFQDEDIAGGITATLHRDGRLAMIGNLNMGGLKIINVAEGVDPGDGVNNGQVISDGSLNGNDLVLTRSVATNIVVSMRPMLDRAHIGSLTHALDVIASVAEPIVDTTSAHRHYLDCDQPMVISFNKQAGVDANLGEDYSFEGQVFIRNITGFGNITLDLTGIQEGDVLGSQPLALNDTFILAYSMSRRAGDNYRAIFSWIGNIP